MPDRTQGLIRRRLAGLYKRFISLKGPPHSVAMGFSVGMMVAVFPILGTHTIVLVALCTVLRCNLTAGMLISWAGNPITIPLYAVVEYEIGRLVLRPVLGQSPAPPISDLTWSFLKANVADVLVPLGAGTVVLSAAVGTFSYFAARYLLVRFRDEKSSA